MSTALAKPDRPLELTSKEAAFVEFLATAKSPTEAARNAGYKNPGESARQIMKKIARMPVPMIRAGLMQRGLDPVTIGHKLAEFAGERDKIGFNALMAAASLWGVNMRSAGADDNRAPVKIQGHNVQIIVGKSDEEPLKRLLEGNPPAA